MTARASLACRPRDRAAARRPRPGRRWPVAILLALALTASAERAAARTVVTRYTYNADGAPTAATVMHGPTAVTRYLTWDNFTPAAAAPSRGMVRAGDGNLLAIGPQPGAAGATLALAFDQRDRLTACRRGERAVAFAHDPISLLASATRAGDSARRFYHDDGAVARMTNLVDTGAGTTASFLGPLYYAGDGGEQALLQPRRDTAAVYAPQTGGLTSQRYDPYGADAGAAPDDDPQAPPFRYAGEYEEASCGTYYLRARWYLPELATFVARDPVEKLQRYTYAAANPVNRADPTGLSPGFDAFRRGVNRFLQRLGPGGAALALLPVTGELTFALQLSANGGEYFHSWTDAAMLAVGIGTALSEGVEGVRDVAPLERTLGGSGRAFGARLGIDGLVGAGQAVLAGFGGGTGRRFAPRAFAENLGVSAATVFAGRLVAGIGYRPFSLNGADVDRQVAAHFAQAASVDEALVYRTQTPDGGVRLTSPLLEAAGVGIYHEGIVAIDRANASIADVRYGALRVDTGPVYGWVRVSDSRSYGRSPSRVIMPSHAPMTFRYVGAFARDRVQTALADTNPFAVPTTAEQAARLERSEALVDPPALHMLRRNCHAHAAAILRAMTP